MEVLYDNIEIITENIKRDKWPENGLANRMYKSIANYYFSNNVTQKGKEENITLLAGDNRLIKSFINIDFNTTCSYYGFTPI
jgi:hypothetical protein